MLGPDRAQDLGQWFHQAVESPGELDYAEALAWFGLRFAGPLPPDAAPAAAWQLEPDPAASEEQAAHLRALLEASPAGP